MFTKSKISQSMIDAVKSVMNEEDKKLLLEPGKKPVKIPTPTGTKVLGRSYGNSAKAHQDQTKHSVDDVKDPKKKDLEKDSHLYKKEPEYMKKHWRTHGIDYFSKLGEEGDCVTEPEAKNIAKKEVKGHEKSMHHKEEMTLGHKWKEKAKAKIKENKGNQPQETFTDNNMGEEVRKSDVPAYLRKQKGEKPLTVADVKGPKKDTISHPENLAKAKNEWKEDFSDEWEGEQLDEAPKEISQLKKKITRYDDAKQEIRWGKRDPLNDPYGGGGSRADVKSKSKGTAATNRTLKSNIKRSLGTHTAPRLPEEIELSEAEVTTAAKSPDDVTTDMLRGRVKGGNSNTFKSYKLELKTDGEMKAPPLKDAEETAARKSIKAKEPHVNLPNLKVEEATEVELDQMINEVLSKDASAGDWIHDFIHSKNPKFAGKSKAERKKMALGAYYGKKNEEAGEGAWHKETPWKKSPGTVTDKSGAKHTPMSRAKDLARSAFKKLQKETMMGKISN
jgi:hypothetical protein